MDYVCSQSSPCAWSHNTQSKASLGPYAWQYSSDVSTTDTSASDMEVSFDAPLPLQTDCASTVSSRKVLGTHTSYGAAFLQHPDLRMLPRSSTVFAKIHEDPVLSYNLPPPGVTAGKVLQHAVAEFQRLRRKYEPLTFKFGITHCASFRWHNRRFGYKYSRDIFARMRVIYAASNPHGPAFLEASLISQFGCIMTASSVLIVIFYNQQTCNMSGQCC